MKRSVIECTESGIVLTPDGGEIWMTKHEIAHLLGCFVAKVVSNIPVVLKSGVLVESRVRRHHRCDNGNGIGLYNLEMIMALSFRIRTHNSDLFRQWLMERLLRVNTGKPTAVLITLPAGSLPN